MSTAVKQPSVSPDSLHIQRPVNQLADRSKIRADIVLKGTDDVRERIACALSARTGSVTVGRYGYSMSRLTARCSGNWEGKRFFAKILLANPYPIPARFSEPWEPPHSSAMPVRDIKEQIETEWNMALQMRALSGGRSVPAPLGKSFSARTIVWEEVSGISLIRAMKWSRWKNSMAKAGTRALFQAGTWLRNVHEASCRGMQLVDVPHLIRIANGLGPQTDESASKYDRIASRILDALLTQLGGTGTFVVPVALTHGDFCLSNLLWDNARWQLGVIDFELSSLRPIYYDLFALLSHLRSGFLNPLIPKSVLLSWEESFWWGYGPVSAQVAAFVKALAFARIFYYNLSRLQTRRERKGWLGGVNARLYRTFLERTIIARRLDLPFAFGCSAGTE